MTASDFAGVLYASILPQKNDGEEVSRASSDSLPFAISILLYSRRENEGYLTFVAKTMKNDRKNTPSMPKCRFGYEHCDFKFFNILVNTF